MTRSVLTHEDLKGLTPHVVDVFLKDLACCVMNAFIESDKLSFKDATSALHDFKRSLFRGYRPEFRGYLETGVDLQETVLINVLQRHLLEHMRELEQGMRWLQEAVVASRYMRQVRRRLRGYSPLRRDYIDDASYQAALDLDANESDLVDFLNGMTVDATARFMPLLPEG